MCRRVCVLRERGQHGEAEQLRTTSLAELVAALKSPAETDATITARLETIFAAETERVANAMVLADLLVPRLTEQLRSFAPLPGMTPAAVNAAAPAMPPPKPAPARAATISIADFIDDMIAQENPPVRPAR
jgi:hypothetical protein